jgi:hypothetical protein
MPGLDASRKGFASASPHITAKASSAARLRDKAENDQVRDALAIGPGALWVSRLDLNERFGRFEMADCRQALQLDRAASAARTQIIVKQH